MNIVKSLSLYEKQLNSNFIIYIYNIIIGKKYVNRIHKKISDIFYKGIYENPDSIITIYEIYKFTNINENTLKDFYDEDICKLIIYFCNIDNDIGKDIVYNILTNLYEIPLFLKDLFCIEHHNINNYIICDGINIYDDFEKTYNYCIDDLASGDKSIYLLFWIELLKDNINNESISDEYWLKVVIYIGNWLEKHHYNSIIRKLINSNYIKYLFTCDC